MYKAVLFDIDGVLCNSKPLHEFAFLMAIKDFGYSLAAGEHKIKYDGLPTKVKLERLNIPLELREKIEARKQEYTFKNIERYIKFDESKLEIFKDLHSNDLKIAVCSNAIRMFCVKTLDILKLTDFISVLLSNEDVKATKPSSEIYLKAMNTLNVSPKETIIFEDSIFGLSSAFNSGATVCVIEDPSYLTLSKIRKYIC